MAISINSFRLRIFLFLFLASQSLALIPYPQAISDLKDATVKSLGLQSDDLKISGFDIRDVRVGHSVAYEFDVEIDNQVLPFKLLEDIKRWEYADLPIFRVEELIEDEDENGIVEKSRLASHSPPVLAPFQLAGPMELWIQDAKDVRISLPHDVEAGVLKKVILAEGAVVTVKGARSVSLRHPLDLPLPLNQTTNAFASGLLAIAETLRLTALTRKADPPLLSLRIVGPTSIASSSSSSGDRLKLKRLAPGLVELSSPGRRASDINLREPEAGAASLLTPTHFTTTALWPVVSVKGSNRNLLGFEKLLGSVLGPKAEGGGSFKLIKADVSAQTYVKVGFAVEKKLTDGSTGVDFSGFPEWRTRPDSVRLRFEVLARVDGDKVVAERVIPMGPIVEDTVGPEFFSGNVSMSRVPIIHPPPDPFAL